MILFEFWQSLNKRLNEVLGGKRSMEMAVHINQLLNSASTMSTMPSQSNKVTNAPFKNPELFQEDLDVEEDPEKIQQEADKHIVAVNICNEKRWLEWEDWKQKEEEEQK